jgi:hypothetical protein
MPPEALAFGSAQERLQTLRSAYPLADNWSEPELFVDEAVIEDTTIHLVGLFARSATGREVTGSAASTDTAPVERAFFELLERASVVDATAGTAAFRVLDERGEVCEECEHGALFPQDVPGASFRYALSNGVAAGSSFESAARAAFGELVERDRILRSWYGAIRPVRVAAAPPAVLDRLSSVYRFETFAFPGSSGRGEGLEVVGIYGFPRRAGIPLIRGTGAGLDRHDALLRATRECLQTLGFLWGESLPESEPDVSTTAEYHQDYYLWPESQPHLERWLRGERVRDSLRLHPREIPRCAGPKFADLTPPHLASRLHVLKALPETELPVVFGRGHPWVASSGLDDLGVHPVS